MRAYLGGAAENMIWSGAPLLFKLERQCAANLPHHLFKTGIRTVLNMNKNQFRTVHIVSDPEQLFALDSA